MKGSVFVQQIGGLQRIPDREKAIEKAVEDGLAVKWPMVEVDVPAGDSVLTVRVAADYLAIGEPGDFVRVPLSPLSAQRICDTLEAMLPTPRLVDLIWKNADVRLKPQPMGPPYDGTMLTVGRFAEHDKRVESQLAGRTGLIAGHKKDVVLSQRLVVQPGRVAIYGWHQPNGTPIQPVSLVHENTYADYSHGIRLVSRTAYLDGAPVSLEAVLKSADLAGYLSAEGPLGEVRVPGVAVPGIPDDFGKPLGLRAIAVAEVELSKPGWESPPGSLSGPRIVQYFAGCTRKGKPLGIASGNWCAAFASFCETRAVHDGDDLPHGYRAAVAELWADALQSGSARLKSSGYKPRAGDLALYARAGQDPTKGGKGHVGRVCREVDAGGTYETLEGNHFGAVARVTRTLAETVAFIAYPQNGEGIGVATEDELAAGSVLLEDPPSDDTPETAFGPQRLPPDKTPVTEVQLYAALDRSWKKQLGGTPSRASLLVLLAHWALETGRGKSMRAYNLGNIKSRVGDGHDYTYFLCNELINGKWVWFYPDDPGCRFRAHRTLDLGVDDYLSTVRKRFDKSWSAVIAGSPAEFCHLLKVQKYYTADEAKYTAAVVSLFNEYSKTIAAGGSGLNLTTTAGVQAALAKLGYDPGAMTGQPGPKYLSAVKAFQAAHGLEVDGIVGPLTRGALATALAARAPADGRDFSFLPVTLVPEVVLAPEPPSLLDRLVSAFSRQRPSADFPALRAAFRVAARRFGFALAAPPAPDGRTGRELAPRSAIEIPVRGREIRIQPGASTSPSRAPRPPAAGPTAGHADHG